MNSKDKAKELCYLYQGDFEKGIPNMSWTMAKKCALIACDFAEEFITGNLNESFDKTMYLFDVKQEIKKL